MDGYGLTIALVAVLVLLNAVFAGSEMALISLREGQLRALERDGRAGARTLVRLARDPNRFLATIQIGITLAGFLASATAAVSLAEPLVPLLDFLGGAANAVAIALVTVVLTFLTLVFGELAPKRLAMQNALRWAMLVARPLDVLSTVSRPAVWALSASTNLVVRLFGGKPDTESAQMSPEEFEDVIEPLGEGRWRVPGRMRVDEIADATGVELPEHDTYDTVSGLVLSRLGRTAQIDDVITLDGLSLRVTAVTRNVPDSVVLATRSADRENAR